jgi:competence protein ComEC
LTLESQNSDDQRLVAALRRPVEAVRALFGWLQIAWTRLVEALAAETDRWFLWAPVFVGLGIALYFSLPFEPPLWAAALLASLALAVLFVLRRGRSGMAMLFAAACFCLALGLAAATLRTALVAAPILQSSWSGTLTGRLIEVESTGPHALTALIAPVEMQHLAPAATPARLRISIRIKGVEIVPGETLRLRARIRPPPNPVEPGGFDYARKIWFERIGGTGFAYTAPVVVAPPPHDMTTWLARLRASITTHVHEIVGGATGTVAAALIAGEQRAIPDDVVLDLRRAGLAHVLSISGLHMVLFAGSFFWLLRAVLACSARLALHYPIKKWAAAIAIVAATGYLLLSGAEVATQRSWVMIVLMFAAILIDRRTISMRNVSLAALILLIWQPESILSASFHMSFAAVVALVAFYETPMVQRLLAPDRDAARLSWFGPLHLASRHFLGIASTTLVAGLATGAYSAFHFNQIQPYSMLGNLGALPIVSIIVMPSALAALLLMPFGLDGPALWLMGKGIDAMLAVAHFVSGLSGSQGLVGNAPMASLALVTLGGLWLAFWRRPWRFFGLAPIALGLVLWGSDTQPDLLVGREGKLMATRGPDGALILSGAHPDYTAKMWLRHDGDPRTPREAAVSEFRSCDTLGCVWAVPGKPVVAMPASFAALADDCAHADIVIARFGLPWRLRKSCHARLVIDRFDLWRDGATTVTFTESDWTRATARQARGHRPWVRQPDRKEKKK